MVDYARCRLIPTALVYSLGLAKALLVEPILINQFSDGEIENGRCR